MLRSHDLSCLSVSGGFPGGDEGDRPAYDRRTNHLIVGGLGPPKDLKIFRSLESLEADFLTRRVRFARGELLMLLLLLLSSLLRFVVIISIFMTIILIIIIRMSNYNMFIP